MSGLMFPKPEPRARVKRQKVAQDEAAWLAVCKVVDARDRHHCRACGRRCDPNASDLLRHGHRHHLTYRSAGGQDTTENLVTLCAECHADEHAHRLKVEGNGDTGIEVWRLSTDGWYLVRREVRCGEVERD